MPMPPEYNIEGKVFVAIGAGRGIGRGIVEVLAEAGADGAVVALTPQYVRPFAERLRKRTGRRIEALVADGTSERDLQGVVSRVLHDFGRIDIWINAVGDAISKPLVSRRRSDRSLQPAEPLTDEEWRQVIDINLTSVMAGCRAIGRYFLDRGQGRVINIGSFAGLRGGANLSAYTAAKAGVAGFTRAVALEWAPYGVTVNCIAPGYFPDPEQVPAEQLARRGENLPLRRVGNPREVGLLALYLASDASAYMTGQTIYLDGGMTL